MDENESLFPEHILQDVSLMNILTNNNTTLHPFDPTQPIHQCIPSIAIFDNILYVGLTPRGTHAQ